MGKASDKYHALPGLIILGKPRELIPGIGSDGPGIDIGPQLSYGLYLDLRRIIYHVGLIHDGKLHALPVFCLSLYPYVISELILPLKPEEMEVMPVIDAFYIGIVLYEVYVLGCDMWPVKIGYVYMSRIFAYPVKYAKLVLISVKHLHSELFKRRSVRLLMEEIVSQELDIEALLEK